MANEIDIIIRAKDEASKTFRDISSAIGISEKNAVKMGLAFSAIGTAAAVASKIIGESINTTIEYSEAVKDVSRITGDSVEESSRLLQVTDDLGISNEKLSTILKTGVSKGVDMSIDSLSKLADEYLELDEGLERSEFLIDKFGRSGLEMGKLLEKGSDGIREMADAVSESLVLTDESIDAAYEYELAVKNLEGSFDDLKIKIGNEVIPVLNDIIEIWTDPSIRSEGFNRAFGEMTPEFEKVIVGAKETSTELNKLGDSVGRYWSEQARVISDSADEQIEALTEIDKEITKQRDNLTSTSVKWTETFRDQTDAINDLMLEQQTLISEKETLINEGWTPESIAVQDVTRQIDDNISKIDELMKKHEEERMSMLLNVATAGLDEDAKYRIYKAMGLISDETYTLIDSLLEQKGEFSKTGDLDAYETAVMEIYNALKKVDGYHATASVTVTHRDIWQSYMEEGGPMMASGGSFIVPPGYPNDTFPIRVSSGEFVSVTPANQVGAGQPISGGGATVILQYSPVVSMADRYEAETKLVPYIESALRKIR